MSQNEYVSSKIIISTSTAHTLDSCSIGVAFGQSSFIDLDFADDVIELLVPILETIASEAASLGLEVNWQKTSFGLQGGYAINH